MRRVKKLNSNSLYVMSGHDINSRSQPPTPRVAWYLLRSHVGVLTMPVSILIKKKAREIYLMLLYKARLP